MISRTSSYGNIAPALELDSPTYGVISDDHENNGTYTPATQTSRVDQGTASYSQPRTPKPARRIIIERNGITKEAHHERRGEKKNCGFEAGEMGEGKASLVSSMSYQKSADRETIVSLSARV